MNISGGAVARYAPNKDGAVKFLSYLVSLPAQNNAEALRIMDRASWK